MKQNRKNIILVLSIIFIGQIIILLLLNFFSSQSIKSRFFEKKLLKGLNKDDIIFFEISDYQDTLSIEKKDGNWFVKTKSGDIPGDITKINSYLDILRNLNQGIITDKGNAPNCDVCYGFDKENYQKIFIKLANNKNYTIYIGNRGSQRGTFYIRLNEEKKVREVKSDISTETSNQPIQWAKRKIFDDDITIKEVEMCEITSSLEWLKENYTIKYKDNTDDNKKDNFIIIPSIEDKKLKEFALQSVINNILNLKIDEYKFNGDVTQRKKKATIKLTLKNDKLFKLFLYKADEDDVGDYIVDVDFNNYLYLVDENNVKRFIKAKDDLVE